MLFYFFIACFYSALLIFSPDCSGILLRNAMEKKIERKAGLATENYGEKHRNINYFLIAKTYF